MSILNKYKKALNFLRVINDKYYDFVLSLDETEGVDINSALTTNDLSGYIDFTLDECVSDTTFVSLPFYKWENAVNDGVELRDIGFTGIDNGWIKFDKDKIDDADFYKIITNSLIKVESGDTRMHIFPVTGNTKAYTYPYVYHKNEYISLSGGFLQGVFKLDGFNYQILPQYIDNSIHVEFVLRPSNYIIDYTTLNANYPENKGIFFYMGTRAENKFAIINGADISAYPDRQINTEPNCESYFADDYLASENGTETESITTGATTDFSFSGVTILDSNGNDVAKQPITEIKTDNKYLLFNHTNSGFTVDTWNENADYVLEMEKDTIKDNLYLLMNHTPSGYTVDDIKKIRESATDQYKDYDITKDIKNNAFALKINDDGSIGYRYLVQDCDSDTGWSIKEERSFPDIIKTDEWSTINIRFQILNGEADDNGTQLSTRKMKIYIYVNGYLKFISQELDEFTFTRLDEAYTKQECVPFNISLGGGTQGLAEMIWTDYKEISKKVLPIEENFAGTFIGDIRSFKIYTGPMEYNEIKNNYLFENEITKNYGG